MKRSRAAAPPRPSPPPSRRAWLRLAGAGATWLGARAAGLAPWAAGAGCGDDLGDLPPGAGDAAAIFEPRADRFLVAAWSSAGGVAEVEVRAGGALVRATTLALDPATGHGVLDVGGLAPRTLHEVTVTTRGRVRQGPCLVRTAPADDDPAPVRLAVSADFDPSPEFDSELLGHLVAAAPELYVSLGDFPYADNGPPAMTVPAYRARHAALFTHPRVRGLLSAAGVAAIYDDHEFRNNWDARFAAEEAARYAAAMQVWDEWFPLRAAPPEIRYRRWRWGRHVECFLLDTRRFRSADAAPDGPGKTMLGEAQRRWLLDGVTSSAATFKLVFTTVPLDFGTGDDAWPSFAAERDAILAALAAAGTPGVLFLSGDQHYFAAHRHAHGLREFQVGPLARGLGMPGPTAPGVLYRALRYNAGLLEVRADAITVAGLGADGTRFYEETLTPADLAPRPG